MANDNKEIGDIVKKSKILLLDIEGTTTSISFVKDKLFPYAEENVQKFLEGQWENQDVKEAVEGLRKLALEDQEKSVEGVIPIPGEDSSKDDQIKGLVKNVKWLMSTDRKVGALKTLQGLIWKQGYDAGDIKGHVYDDVSAALEQWRSVEGQKVYIYSSGSVQAQKLLFGQSTAGDLLKLIDGHFDTAVGAKQEAASYSAIVDNMGCKSEEVLFLTDIVKEAEAARSAGLNTALVSREGNTPLPEEAIQSFAVLHTLAQLTVTNKRKPDAQEEVPAKVPKTDNCEDVKAASDEKVEVPEKSKEPEKMEVEESVINEQVKSNGDSNGVETDAPTEKISEKPTPDPEPMVEDTAPVAEVKKESINESPKKEVDEKKEAAPEPVSDTTVTAKKEVSEEKPKDEVTNNVESEKVEISETVEQTVTKEAVVTDSVPSDIKEESQSSSQGEEKMETIVEEITDSNEAANVATIDTEPVITESSDQSEQNTDKMETDTIENGESSSNDKKIVNGDKKETLVEETPPAEITEIVEITDDKQCLSEVAEIIEGIEPVVEEPPAVEDMEDLQNVGEVLEKECDEILSKVQDVTNLDNIPLKPLLNSIPEEAMETENTDSNDIVDRILDTELELEMKQSSDVELKTEVTEENKNAPADKVTATTETNNIEKKSEETVVSNNATDEKKEETSPTESPIEKAKDETQAEAPTTESKSEEPKDLPTETKETEPEKETKTDSEPQVNGKTTNGDSEPEVKGLNGDASKDDLSSRLSVENGKEMNGSNGDSNDTEQGQGDTKAEPEVSEIKVKSVATEERPDPIEQPTEA